MNKRQKKKLQKRFIQTIFTDYNDNVYLVIRDTYKRHDCIVKAYLLKNVYPVSIDTQDGHCINDSATITFKSHNIDNNDDVRNAEESVIDQFIRCWFNAVKNPNPQINAYQDIS